jgi:hypothetical protein
VIPAPIFISTQYYVIIQLTMPPEENKLKIGLDPVFKSTPNQSQNNTSPNIGAGAYNILNNQKYTSGQTTPIQPFKLPENNQGTPKSIVRTFKGDMESAIAANHLSSINIAIAENQKMQEKIRTEQKEEPAEQTASTSNYSKSKIFIFVSLLLIVSGIIGVSAVYIMRGFSTTQTNRVQELPSLITTEYKDELNTSSIIKGKLVSALGSKLSDIQVPDNNFYNTYLTIGTGTERRLVTGTEFVSLTGLKMPDIIRRTLLPDFMVGMYSYGTNLPFVIFKTSYFENAYAGMLQWESDLEKDFQTLFKLPGYESAGSLITALTPATAKVFSDGVIVNKDVRILRNDKGEMILLYGIIDKETIIITINDVAFKEIINRLNKEKTLRR